MSRLSRDSPLQESTDRTQGLCVLSPTLAFNPEKVAIVCGEGADSFVAHSDQLLSES